VLNRIRDVRKKLNMTQEEFADALECTQVSLSAWERGTREPKCETLLQIADMGGCSLDWLLCRGEIEVIDITKNSTPKDVEQSKVVANEAINLVDIGSEDFEKAVRSVFWSLFEKLSQLQSDYEQ